jgi:hypothetical protein
VYRLFCYLTTPFQLHELYGGRLVVTDGLWGVWRDAVVACFKVVFPGTCLEGTDRIPQPEYLAPGQDSNREPSVNGDDAGGFMVCA